MEPSPVLPSIYQLRVVLRGISPIIWRRILIRSDTTLAQLHHILQIAFGWSAEHLHHFHIYGKDYGSSGADTRHVLLAEFRFYPGERFRYVYDYIAYWVCDLRLEAILPFDPQRFYPVCIGGNHASPAEDCPGAWAYLERLERRLSNPPIEAMLVLADAVRVLLETEPQISVREAIGDLDPIREAADCLETYQQFQPDRWSRGYTNAQLRARAWPEGGKP